MSNHETAFIKDFQNSYENIAYGTNHPQQTMNITLPKEGKGPFPVVVFIHGGGWASGDKQSENALKILSITKYGYAVASLNYRLTPDGVWTNQIYDVKKALYFLRKYGAIYHLTTEKLVLWGVSAGAHIAQVVAATGGTNYVSALKEENKFTSVQGLISLFGISEPAYLDDDIEKQTGIPSTKHGSTPECRPCLMTGFVINENKERALEMGSIRYIHPPFVPTFIQHGTGDLLVSYLQSVRLQKIIKERCPEQEVILELFPEAVHADDAFYKEENLLHIKEFLDKIYFD